MGMFKNISDDKVDFYCDNRLAAVEELDYVITELESIVGTVKVLTTDAEPAFQKIEKLIKNLKDEPGCR